MRLLYFLVFALGCLCLNAQEKVVVSKVEVPSSATFRAVRATSDSVVWVSGSKGCVLRSLNYGEGWRMFSPDSLNKSDFRSLYAWGKDTAVVFTAGNPALGFRTEDGGESWYKVFEMHHPKVFINSIDFMNSDNGVAWGDPIDGIFFMLHTQDGGRSWQEMNAPFSIDGDGGFAASNMCVQYLPSGKIVFVTGVRRSCFYYLEQLVDKWKFSHVPIVENGPSRADGIYCIKMFDDNFGIAAGGNYTKVSTNENIIAITHDGGETWISPNSLPHGFISAIGALSPDNKLIIAIGSHGSSLSRDGGVNWTFNSDDGYHALSVSPSGKYIYFVGEKGKVGRCIMEL